MTKPNLIFAILDRQETATYPPWTVHQRSIHGHEWPHPVKVDHELGVGEIGKNGRGGHKWPKLNFNWILEVLIIWYFWCLGF